MASKIKTKEQFEQVMAEGGPIIFEKGIGLAPRDGGVQPEAKPAGYAEPDQTGHDTFGWVQPRQTSAPLLRS